MTESDGHNWIEVFNPLDEFKAISIIALAIWCLLLIILFIGWNDYSWQGSHLTIKPGGIGMWIFALLLPAALFTFFTVMAYSFSILSISAEDEDLYLKYTMNRIRKSPWINFQKLGVLKGKKEYPDSSGLITEVATISLKLGHKDYVVFTVDLKTMDKIVSL